jgi:histidyl-tRNA synthetase
MGPMFRYERPQKGRYRQFHQIGAEVIGIDSPLIDAQVLVMLSHFFEVAGIRDVALQINSLGCPECRPGYRQMLVDFLTPKVAQLCGDCQRRVATNPLRVLDCKVPTCKEATVGAPSILDALCGGCNEHFAAVQKHLQQVGTPFSINPRMVRGLDYYTKTTFEMVTANLGAQSAVAAGGRYDGLIESLGGPALPGIGFAIGLERLVLLRGDDRVTSARPELFVAALGDAARDLAFPLLTGLLRQGFKVDMDFSGKSLKSQLRRADKLQAKRVLIVGEGEIAEGKAQLRDMDSATQQTLPLENLAEALGELLRG